MTTVLRFGLPKTLKLLKKEEFENGFGNGKRIRLSQFTAICCPNQLSTPRLGFVVGRKHARRAVDRNRVKRQCRESFRLNQHKLPAFDIILLARIGIGTKPKEEIAQCLEQLWLELVKQAAAPACC